MDGPVKITAGKISLSLGEYQSSTDPLLMRVSQIEGHNKLVQDDYKFNIEFAETVKGGQQMSGVYSMTVNKKGPDATQPTMLIQ